jgi:alkylation response protein AidB-like acyl-CoA dehydrogenase
MRHVELCISLVQEYSLAPFAPLVRYPQLCRINGDRAAEQRAAINSIDSVSIEEAPPMTNAASAVAEYRIERIVCDLRVHRILEGTNEVIRRIIDRGLVDRAH